MKPTINESGNNTRVQLKTKNFQKLPIVFVDLAAIPFMIPAIRCHTGSGGNELEQHNDEQLCKICQSAFTGIMLQITVHHKLIHVLNASPVSG